MSMEKSLKKIYEKCKPQMIKKFGRILSYEEFCQILFYAHEKKDISQLAERTLYSRGSSDSLVTEGSARKRSGAPLQGTPEAAAPGSCCKG